MILAEGTEPDGITYKCTLAGQQFVVTVSNAEGEKLTESFHWTHEPRAGIDVADVAKGEETMDRLIKQLRKPK